MLKVNIGDKFGKLTVEWFVFRKKSFDYFMCKCECGQHKTIRVDGLKTGHAKSCGCIRGENHGLTKTSEYEIWCAMKSRCSNPKNKKYLNYGARGIRVCPRWRTSFASFYQDMGPRPDGMTLERIDNDGNYYKNNCQWATYKEQNRNNRHTRVLEFNGKTQCLTDWADEVGINPRTLTYRLNAGWSIEKALWEKSALKKQE